MWLSSFACCHHGLWSPSSSKSELLLLWRIQSLANHFYWVFLVLSVLGGEDGRTINVRAVLSAAGKNVSYCSMEKCTSWWGEFHCLKTGAGPNEHITGVVRSSHAIRGSGGGLVWPQIHEIRRCLSSGWCRDTRDFTGLDLQVCLHHGPVVSGSCLARDVSIDGKSINCPGKICCRCCAQRLNFGS